MSREDYIVEEGLYCGGGIILWGLIIMAVNVLYCRGCIILSRGYYIVGKELYGCGDIILSK